VKNIDRSKKFPRYARKKIPVHCAASIYARSSPGLQPRSHTSTAWLTL